LAGLNILAALAVGLLSNSSCGNAAFSLPPLMDIKPPPITATIGQISHDYTSDAVAADVKYRGQRVLFTNVEVDGVCERYQSTNWTGAQVFVKLYFTSGSVRFTLRDFELMQSVQEGYILHLVGECDGFRDGQVIISDCWVQSVSGELSSAPLWAGGY
jgi:hypothetical protein